MKLPNTVNGAIGKRSGNIHEPRHTANRASTSQKVMYSLKVRLNR